MDLEKIKNRIDYYKNLELEISKELRKNPKDKGFLCDRRWVNTIIEELVCVYENKNLLV